MHEDSAGRLLLGTGGGVIAFQNGQFSFDRANIFSRAPLAIYQDRQGAFWCSFHKALLREKAKDSTNVWNSILERGGSVQHLDFLSPEEKAVYKTSFEIDQRWLLEFAADRAPYIDQAQSLNLFIPADVDKWDLMMLHFQAWEKGIKSLYYLRSKSVQRAGFAGGVEADNTADAPRIELNAGQTDYEECLSCQ